MEAVTSEIIIDSEFSRQVLKPYRKHTTYLKKTVCHWNKDKNYPTMKGDFQINESCYIDDTGHFNAVEFNICYNQLGYTYLGHCIKEGILPELSYFAQGNNSEFFEKQLSHFLIVDIHSTYKRPINAKQFYGETTIKSISKKANFTFIVMPCKFYDDGNGKAFGEVKLAIIDPI